MQHISRRKFMVWSGKACVSAVCAGSLLSGLLAGCKTGGVVGELGRATGVLDDEQARAVARVATALGRSFEDITPEQEFYIGRTVGATILGSYAPYADPAATSYINLVGTLVSLSSDMPETFGGYHFMILDSDEINAFAAPGGLIFVTRGMLRCCTSEDAVAAVLAHEIGHIQHRHGIQTIQRARVTSAFTILAAEGARTLGGRDLVQLTEIFEESVSDVINTLAVNGYSRSAEREADRSAVMILDRAGYDSAALVNMLEVMDTKLTPGGLDFARTHPAPASRIRDIRPILPALRTSDPALRQERFLTALHRI
ncbi:M48 family metalloprotease [Desulfonatronum thioautotrophicum]|uniref:M48 family metalloprotease n=1 Tax=Desulfonatronum thioautotrophicum TaxID=617001 RepID=UPI0009FECBB9|nr:M48 family metalloprotease [Desulfonatronum thioautotrophicum]